MLLKSLDSLGGQLWSSFELHQHRVKPEQHCLALWLRSVLRVGVRYHPTTLSVRLFFAGSLASSSKGSGGNTSHEVLVNTGSAKSFLDRLDVRIKLFDRCRHAGGGSYGINLLNVHDAL